MASTYWQDRQAAAQAKLTNKKIKETEQQLQKYYIKSMRRVIKDFEATYDKLIATAANGVPLTPADLYKLDNYWQMQGQLKVELEKFGNKQAQILSKKFLEEFAEIYRAIAIKNDLFFGEVDIEAAQQIINSIWCADGKSWSARIWDNIDLLQQTLNDSLVECVITGKPTTELKQMLKQRFSVSYSNADSLVRTEMAHIQTQAAQKRYTDYGIKEVEVWADEDERRCKVCGKLHKTKYPVGAVMPVPAHPRCRCCIIPVVD